MQILFQILVYNPCSPRKNLLENEILFTTTVRDDGLCCKKHIKNKPKQNSPQHSSAFFSLPDFFLLSFISVLPDDDDPSGVSLKSLVFSWSFFKYELRRGENEFVVVERFR